MENKLYCSSCKCKNGLQTRYLACGSLSTWSINNYPSPITYETTKDELIIWEISLCETCIPKAFKVFLENKIKKSLNIFWVCLLCLVIASGAFFLMSLGRIHSSIKILNLILSIAVTIAAFIGVIGVPLYIIKMIIDKIRLSKFTRSEIVKEKDTNKSFQGEGERLIKLAEGSKSDIGLQLPGFTSKNKLNLSNKDKSKVSLDKRERIIVSVSESFEDLKKALSDEWLILS